MQIFRRLCAAAAAVIVAMSSGVLIAHGDDTPPVYTTPGGQISQGRLWNTTCEKYSTTIVRCRAEIWATTVVYSNGRYVSRTGWSFNNLSYLPSSRSAWATNNLGRTNPNWTQSGRQWRTECDTAATGRGGCRSFLLTDVVKPRPGGGYMNAKAWVFNNVVLFSSRTIPAVNTVPPWVMDCTGQWLAPQGLRCGPLRIDNDGNDLERLGFVKPFSGLCETWDETLSLENRGIRTRFAGDDLSAVIARTSFIPTQAGARVGMTVGQVRALYGASFTVVQKENFGSKQYFGTVKEGAFELQFRVAGPSGTFAPERPLVDSDVIADIMAQRYTDDVSWEGC